MTPNPNTRAALLSALADLGRLRPEWRVGQTLANLAMTAGRLDAGAVWDIEDEEALAAARELIGQSSEALAVPPRVAAVSIGTISTVAGV
jgi:hypothetical protein